MESKKQQFENRKQTNQLNTNDQMIVQGHLIYKNFANKSCQSFLGISVQKERLYVVQKKTISVFQYFIGYQTQISQQGPVLIKEIFLPFEISKYIITEKYICIKSKNKTQIRDNEFEKVYYSENKGILTTRPKNQGQDSCNSNNFTFDSVQELELECEILNDDMISWKVLIKKKSNNLFDPKYLREYWSERYNILIRHKSIIKCRTEMIDPTNKNRKVQICKSPVFINQLGYIQNFYIWPESSNDIQIGIFFNQKQHENVTENALYEICRFQLKETNIKNVFYYDFKGLNSHSKNKDGPHLFLAVCQNPSKEKSKVKIVIFEILPQQNIGNDQSQNEALNKYLDQFNQIRKQKKSQQSISNSFLLNELLNNEAKSSSGSNPNKPTAILQSFIIKNSGSLKKVIYNPLTRILWIYDCSDLIYKIKFVETGDIKKIKEESASFIQSQEGYQNGETGSDLEGIMYDNYPIFKTKAFNLQIGLKSEMIHSQNQAFLSGQQNTFQKDFEDKAFPDDSKEVIQFNDNEIQKIEQQKSQNQMHTVTKTKNAQVKQTSAIEKQSKQVQIQTEEVTIENKKQKNNILQLQNQQTQTQTDSKQEQKKEEIQQNHIQVNNLSELLKELNFNKVEDVLIRFSTLFTANITKNVNKLKDFNVKAKDEIKLKISGDIFELIKEVFSSLMNEALAEKIQKQVGKAREFVEKIFGKHMEHFNLMMLEQKIKQENVKKHILEEQLRSIEVIKEASLKFLDVTKVREMQKIAYNQLVVQSIREVGQKIESLQSKVTQMFQQSEEVEKKIIADVKEIKETFKLLIDLEENQSQEEESKNDEEEGSESGFQSEEDEEESEEERGIDKKHVFDQKMIPSRQGVQPQQYPYVSPHVQPFSERAPSWNSSYYQGPVNYSYPPSYPPSLPPSNVQPHYPPVYSPYTQPYHPHQNPYQSTIPSHQQPYFPPPYQVHPSFSEVRSGSQRVDDPMKVQKKKKSKHTSKQSSSLRNE